MASPQYEARIPIENSGQLGVIVVSALNLIIPAVFVGLRLYARLLTQRQVAASDYLILVALVSRSLTRPSPPRPTRGPRVL